eukprot:5299900-Pleurochrysis_carterae.AAC.3
MPSLSHTTPGTGPLEVAEKRARQYAAVVLCNQNRSSYKICLYFRYTCLRNEHDPILGKTSVNSNVSTVERSSWRETACHAVAAASWPQRSLRSWRTPLTQPTRRRAAHAQTSTAHTVRTSSGQVCALAEGTFIWGSVLSVIVTNKALRHATSSTSTPPASGNKHCVSACSYEALCRTVARGRRTTGRRMRANMGRAGE